MNKNEWKKWVSVVGRMLLAYALVFAQGAWAGQNQGTKDKAASAQKEAAQQANEKQPAAATTADTQTKQAQGEESESAVAEKKGPDDAAHQGIKVHGHWTIEVRNPDGTLVTHREFENSLIPAGGNILVNLLARQWSQGFWAVWIFSNSLSGPCPGPGGCEMEEPQFTTGGTLSVSTMNASIQAPTGPPLPTLVLSGTVVAPASGSIDFVNTYIRVCAAPLAPGANPCVSGGANLRFGYEFSNANLTQSVQVATGQTIAVTVNFTFS